MGLVSRLDSVAVATALTAAKDPKLDIYFPVVPERVLCGEANVMYIWSLILNCRFGYWSRITFLVLYFPGRRIAYSTPYARMMYMS